MKKVVIFCLFFVFFFPTVTKTEAAFIRYSNNPILKPEQNYEINGLYAPSVVYKNNQYYMWYSSLQGSIFTISQAISTDGYSWLKSANNPVIVPDTSNTVICEKGVHDPDVLWNSNLNKFQIWYVVNCEPQSTGTPRYWVKYGESPDGINWSIQQSPVLSPSLAWEQEGISFPTVILDEPIYEMWYSGRDSGGSWKIGYATSPDGKNWTKHPQNPLISPTQTWEVSHIGGSDVIKENNSYTMYYHGAPIWPPVNLIYATSSDGITWQKPNDNPIITINQTETKISTPDIVKDSFDYKIYYSAIINGVWQISLLTDNLPFPTPTPTPNTPIVILPGFLGSWNKEAILHNQTSNSSQWKLNPMVKDYNGIIKTLTNLGRTENQDFFVFTYDWRKGLNNLADDLNDYLNQLTTSNQFPINNFNLIGHSLGGLVARIYAQKYGIEKINKLLTVGSPHQGTAQAYKPVEAGELDRANNLLWLAEKIILALNKDSFETDKETINQILPVAKDLLPTYDYLKNQNNQKIAIQTMQIKNDTLLSYNSNLPNLLQTIAGEKGNALSGFKIGQRTILDQLLDFYPDGRPIENHYQIGDYIITSNSAQAGDNQVILNLDHGEIVYKSEGIKKILDVLDVNYQNNLISEGAATQIFPSLIFLIKSPAEMEVNFNGETFHEQDGLIFVENTSTGNYTLNVKGKEKGRYTVIIGQITEQNDRWETIEGEITQIPPASQTDSYQINFNPQSPQLPLSDPSVLFDELILYLSDINRHLSGPGKNYLTKAINNLKLAKQRYQQNNKGRLKSALQLTHQQLFLTRTKVNDSDKKKILYAIEKLENLYEKSLVSYVFGVYSSRIKKDLTNYKKLIGPTQKYLLSKKQRGKNVVKNANILIEIETRLNSVEENLNKNNLNLAEILLKSVGELVKEVRKL